jgi:hypothetical protein
VNDCFRLAVALRAVGDDRATAGCYLRAAYPGGRPNALDAALDAAYS